MPTASRCRPHYGLGARWNSGSLPWSFEVIADPVQPSKARSRQLGRKGGLTPSRSCRAHPPGFVIVFELFAPSLCVGSKLYHTAIDSGRNRRAGRDEDTIDQPSRGKHSGKNTGYEKNARGRLARPRISAAPLNARAHIPGPFQYFHTTDG